MTAKFKKPKYTFELLKGPSGQWYWRVRHRNGLLVSYSGETYKNKGDCKRALGRLMAAVENEDYAIEEVLNGIIVLER